jgi:5-hydroxyisourate hydrolase-like protein (transthyretin family)
MSIIIEKSVDRLRNPLSVIEGNAELLKKPEVSAHVQMVKVRILRIEEMLKTEDETLKSVVSLKGRTRTALNAQILRCITKVNGHKVANSGAIPALIIKKSATKLKTLKEKAFISLLTELMAYVSTNKVSLAEMDYSNKDVETFLSMAQSYIDSCSRQKSCKIMTAARNTMIKDEIKEATLEIKNLDVVVESYKQEFPETFVRYRLDRKKQGSQGQKVSVLGSFVDAKTGEPAQSVIVKIYRLENDEQVKLLKAEQFTPASSAKPVVIRKTSAKGRINCRNLEAGSYVAVISKAGFVSKCVPIYVNPKETFVLKIDMEHEF